MLSRGWVLEPAEVPWLAEVCCLFPPRRSNTVNLAAGAAAMDDSTFPLLEDVATLKIDIEKFSKYQGANVLSAIEIREHVRSDGFLAP